jgi:hypothetical protein
MADDTKRYRAPARELVPLSVIAEHAGVSLGTVRRWAARGTLPVYRLAATGVKPGPLRADLADLELVIRRERPEQVYSRYEPKEPER